MKTKTTFYLTGLSVKILAIVMTAALSALTIVLICNISEVPWYFITFSIVVTLALFFGCYLFFFNRITLEQDIIKIKSFKLKKLKLTEIASVGIDTNFSLDKSKYCFIIFKLTNSEIVKISGFSKMFNKNSVQKSEKIVEQINFILQNR